MSERVRVTAEELQLKWMSPEARGMVHDYRTEEVVVLMDDGTAYACTFADKQRQTIAEAQL